jgi:VWFA-related protein
MQRNFRHFLTISITILGLSLAAAAQSVTRDLKLADGAAIDIVNHFGRVSVVAKPLEKDVTTSGTVVASSPKGVTDAEIRLSTVAGRTLVEVTSTDSRKRIDLTLSLPERALVKVDTLAGAVDLAGNIAVIDVKTETGTVAVDVPAESLSYHFLWTESRPRYVSDFELSAVKELTAGRFEIKGTYADVGQVETKKAKGKNEDDDTKAEDPALDLKEPSAKEDEPVSKAVALNFTTARGIILVNVPPNEVGSDLRERPLTNAAKAIVRSGDSLLMEAIRRAAPKYYGEYSRSLPPLKREPTFTAKQTVSDGPSAQLKEALVRVADIRNRAIAGLEAKDFEVTEGGASREVVSVTQSTAPFNLVLLLDVSGSVENYVTFIRKAARNFVDTVDKNDRISIIIFNDDVKVLSKFTTDKGKLSESLDTFDAGGGTAYYDALAFTVADTLRPLKGDRTAIVILTDGDDNRSFLAFDSLMGSIQESGALIYPLYVPSGLIALAAQNGNADIDPMRKKYMSLSAKSEGEGEKLAKVSGGVYYSISQLGQIQKAYEDIVLQLRTAYNVTYRSERPETGSGVSPRLKIKVKRDNAYTTVNSVKAVQ